MQVPLREKLYGKECIVWEGDKLCSTDIRWFVGLSG